MNNLKQCFYRKTSRSVPIDVIENNNASQLLEALDGENNIRKIFNKMKMPQAEFKKTLLNLAKHGLIEKLDPEEKMVDPVFFQKLREKLNQIDGSPGETILDDKASAMGIDLDRIPVIDAAFIIEMVADEIKSEIIRSNFIVWAVEKLKDLGC